ncbi:hypothetical protein GLOIN_2v1763250 [Rhizophagus irregularis DAOM 181602=DAOM 197198]|nr:hypothetical protein GLOIN_2v1763250 [Rhizophagus irregularis DAOM 181602=DAOM 197198]
MCMHHNFLERGLVLSTFFPPLFLPSVFSWIIIGSGSSTGLLFSRSSGWAPAPLEFDGRIYDENDGDENDGDEDNGNENDGDENDDGEDEDDYNEEEFFASPEIDNDEVFLAVCNNFHELYNVKNIVEYKEEGKAAIANFLHEEFPNNPVPSHRNKCNNPLSILKKRESEIIVESRMIYPKPRIQREGVNIYSDIYDGNVWKTFSFDGNPFFTSETATTNLGLLINLNWFQLFTYTQHSTGAIYASICNLSRSERNKPENIIYLDFLPGPKEVRLDRINHYLAPIVDELLELWKGWRIPKTHHYPDGLDIKVALIVGSSDIPATRKKRSFYSEEYRKNHYGGDHNYELSNAESHRKHAYEWLQCNSKNSKELLHLPYMDPICFAVVDPMHCLFLGVAKWIIKSIL